MFTVDQITQNIINQLQLLDPAVSAEVGTPERKIIEATAEMIASSQVDFTVLNQQQDLDAMSGGRLDAYLSIFNFGRQAATPSYGVVTFSRSAASTDAIVIPAGTQVVANIDDNLFPQINYITLQTVILEAGQTSVTAPVQCTIAGTIGNIDAGQIVGFGSLRTINGITTVTNNAPIVGGADAESDSQYKLRFQNTFLRNISGTTDMFLALAVGTTGVSKANVVGPMSRYQEYIQIPTDRDDALETQTGSYDDTGTIWVHKRTSAVSTIPYSKYTYPNNYYLTNSTLDPATAVFFRPEVDYVFNTPPQDASANGTNEVQRITKTATGGSYKIIFQGQTTGSILYNADGTAVQTALEALSNIAVGDVSVSGAAGGPWDITFTGEYKYRDMAQVTLDTTGLTGGSASVSTTTAGVPSAQVDNTPATSPNITFLDPYDTADNSAGNPNLLIGDVVLLEHAYISLNSRNDPTYGILNAVDVFIDGQNLASGSSVEVVPGTTHDLQNTNATLWTYQKTTTTKVINFRRAIDSAECTVGSRIQPLYWQPIIDLPETIQIGDSTYYKANWYNSSDSTYYNQYDPTAGTYSFKAHFALAVEVNSYHGTIRSRNGIEWFLSGNNYLRGALADDGEVYSGEYVNSQEGVEFTIENYLYDRNVSDLQAVTEKNKQITQDVLVHRTKYRYFRPIVTIMYTLGATRSSVNASINAALEAFFRNQYFGGAVQLSDILQVIHNVPGVDNVRWTNETGNKLEEVGADGRTLSGGPFYITADFYLQDNELPASPSANEVTITVRAQNTWGT